MEEKEVKNIYAIPANYTQCGRDGNSFDPGGLSGTDVDTNAGYDPYCRDGRDADASCSAQCDGY